MVHRWRCRRCDFTVWSAGEGSLSEAVKSHLLEHHRDEVSKEDFRIRWNCPYCDAEGGGHDESEEVAAFESHLFEHVEPLIEAGVHVADDIDGVGSVLVRTPLEGAGADNARIHFLSPGDIVLIITTNPAERIRLLREDLGEWPAWTVVVTTNANPLAGLEDLDLSSAPLEVVKLDKRMGLSDLGETVSRVLHEQETSKGKVVVEFDILPEVIDTFELQSVFQFLHVLSARLERADALAHYYVDPNHQPESTTNVLTELFDMSIRADDRKFVSE